MRWGFWINFFFFYLGASAGGVTLFFTAIFQTQAGNASSSIMTSQPLHSRALSHSRSSEHSQRRPSSQHLDLVVQIGNADSQYPNSLEPPISPILAESPRSFRSSQSLEPRNVEEDVCFPMRRLKPANSFDLSAVNDLDRPKLEKPSSYSEKMANDSDFLLQSPIKRMESHHSKQRKYSLYGDNNTKVRFESETKKRLPHQVTHSFFFQL